ncbi:hypothetical protein F444_03542 [Phytophthora nicotianae P1976]|uniref:Retrotransposon gag domain-containing protein n=1 Tax=Phytophthora nicotianae P1976 TaxID=1317066 RepID=A0A081ATT8_PHYNI|nr:hypothetical protein F444_03542 [Phytophthora nicotianae P1976]
MSDDGVETSKMTFLITTKKKKTGHELKFIIISIPRFSGGTAQDWLRWIKQFEHICELKKWTSEEKALHLNLVLDDEALNSWKVVSASVNVDDKDEFESVYKTWGHMFVPSMYHERLEEELYLFAKKRSETVANCHQRMRNITCMLSNLPSNALELDEQPLILTFKMALPNEWKTAYERSGVHLTSMPKTVQYFERLEISDTLVEPKNMVGAAEIDQKTYEKILELLTRFK